MTPPPPAATTPETRCLDFVVSVRGMAEICGGMLLPNSQRKRTLRDVVCVAGKKYYVLKYLWRRRTLLLGR